MTELKRFRALRPSAKCGRWHSRTAWRKCRVPENNLKIRPATEADVPLLLEFIRALADYEKLLDEVVATEESVLESLIGEKPVAEAKSYSGVYIFLTPISWNMISKNQLRLTPSSS